jgi:hypothetical protein
MLLAGLVVLGGCATGRPEPYSGPTYTRASVDNRSTAELAAMFLAPADAATVENHSLLEVFGPGSILSGIHFYARPRPLRPDICGREILFADFAPLAWSGKDRTAGYRPVRLASVRRHFRIALAPGCEALPGRRFAGIGFRRLPRDPPFTLDDGIAVLRRLAGAQAAARGGGPLPFRLSCTTESSQRGRQCPAETRALLAGLPLHAAISLDRAPFATNTLCGPPLPETGDSVEIDPGDAGGEVWEVRLSEMDGRAAAIALSLQPARDVMRC